VQRALRFRRFLWHGSAFVKAKPCRSLQPGKCTQTMSRASHLEQTCSRSVQLVTSRTEFITQNLIVCELLDHWGKWFGTNLPD
jgi:hypothetical protein